MSCSHHKGMFSTSGSTASAKINNDGLTVLKASYGIQNTFIDVTEQVKNLVQDGELNFTVNSQTLGILDPAPGVKKTFQMQYRINAGNPTLHSKDEGEQVVLSVPNAVNSRLAEEDGKKAPTVIGLIFHSLGMFFLGLLVMSAYYVGEDMFHSGALAVILAAITLGTGGTFGVFVLPIIVFFVFLWDPRY